MAEPIKYSMSAQERKAREDTMRLGKERLGRDYVKLGAGPSKRDVGEMANEFFRGGNRFFSNLDDFVGGSQDLDVLEAATRSIKGFEKRRDVLKENIEFSGDLYDRAFKNSKDVSDLYEDYTDRQIDLTDKSFSASQKAVNLEESYKEAFRENTRWERENRDDPFKFAKLKFQTSTAETHSKTAKVNLGRAGHAAEQDKKRAERDKRKYKEYLEEQIRKKEIWKREDKKWKATKRKLFSDDIDFVIGKTSEPPTEKTKGASGKGSAGASGEEDGFWAKAVKGLKKAKESITRVQAEENAIADLDDEIAQGQTDKGTVKWITKKHIENPELDEEQIAFLEKEKKLMDGFARTVEVTPKGKMMKGGWFQRGKTTAKENIANIMFEEGEITDQERDYIIRSRAFEKNISEARPDIAEVFEQGENIDDGRYQIDMTQKNKKFNDTLSKNTSEAFDQNAYTISEQEKLTRDNRQRVLELTADKLKKTGANIEDVKFLVDQYLETGKATSSDPKINQFLSEEFASTELSIKKEQAAMKLGVNQNAIKANVGSLQNILSHVPPEKQAEVAYNHLKDNLKMTDTEARAYASSAAEAANKFEPYMANLVDMKYTTMGEVERLKTLHASGEITADQLESQLMHVDGLQTVGDHLVDAAIGAVEGNYNYGITKILHHGGIGSDPRKVKNIAERARRNPNTREALRNELMMALQPDLVEDIFDKPVFKLEEEELEFITNERFKLVNFEDDPFQGWFTNIEDIFEEVYDREED